MPDKSPSMISRSTAGEDPAAGSGSSEATSDTADAAGALHRVLSMRQDVENQLAEASDVRRQALTEATALLEDAQSVAAQTTATAATAAESTVEEARERATGIVAEAKAQADRTLLDAQTQAEAIKSEAEEHVAQVRAQALAEAKAKVRRDYAGLQKTLAKLSTDVNARFATLQESLELAELTVDDVSAALGAPEGTDDADGAVAPTVEVPKPARSRKSGKTAAATASTASAVTADQDEEQTVEEVEVVDEENAPVQETVEPAATVDDEAVVVTDVELDDADDADDARDAHEADDTDAAEAQEATREAIVLSLTEDDEDEGEILDDAETDRHDGPRVVHSDVRGGDDDGARPLGWLFRSPQS